MKKVLILLFSILLLATAFASDDYPILNYTNTRSAAMGKITLSNMDESALLYNPAMLRTIRGHYIGLPTMSMAINEEGTDLMDPLSEFMDDYDKIEEDENMIKVLNAYVDGVSATINENGVNKIINENENSVNNQYLRGEFNSFLGGVKRNFGVAMMTSIKSNELGIVNRPDGPVVSINEEMSLEVPIGGAFKINDKIDLGISWRYVYSMKMVNELGANDLIELSDINDNEDLESDEKNKQLLDLLDVNTANGWGTTLGLNYTTNKYIMSLGVKDLLSSLEVNHYVKINEGTDDEETVKEKVGDYKLPTNLKIGISNTPYKNKKTLKKLLWAVELENLLSKDLDGNGYDDENFFKKIHAGAEYNLLQKRFLKLKLRSGLNQGYFSFGLGAKLFILDVEYANYTEELGPHIGMKDENFQKLAFGIKF